jgi:hypothetical protein
MRIAGTPGINCCNSKTVGGVIRTPASLQGSLCGPFASPQQSAAAVARGFDPGYELRRVAGNCDTVTPVV